MSRRRRVLLVAYAAVLFCVSPPAAAAATFTVNDTTDTAGTCPTPTTCSLRQAIGSANATAGDDTIDFSIPNGSTISLTAGTLAVSPTTTTDKLTISGLGAQNLTVRRDPAAGSFSVFTLAAGTTTLSGLTVSNGSVGSFTGSGIHNIATGTILDGAVVSGNTADAGGGAGGGAGGIANLGSMTIRNSTISQNSVTNAGTGQSGGGIVSAGAGLTIVNSTLSGNTVSGSGPSDGGGILAFTAGLTVLSSTIAGNTAENGAGGIFDQASPNLANAIIAKNTGSGANDCGGPSSPTSQGYNLIGSGTGCSYVAATGDQVGTSASPIDPKLGSLGQNGGTTPTMALLAGSLAIDGGNPAAVSDAAPPAAPALIPCSTTDQRGVSRPQRARCDIGAFELPKPSNAFTFGKLKRNKKRGTATQAVNVPGPGTLKLSGKGLVKQRSSGQASASPLLAKTVTAAGIVKLKIKAKGKKKKKLNKKGRVKVKAFFTFTPTDGDPNTKAKTIKLIKRHTRR